MTTDNRGQWQAQGNDIGGKGHCHPWNEAVPPTKDHARAHVARVETLCTKEQRALRDDASRRAHRYIDRAPSDGIPGFHMKSFYVKDPPTKALKARIDLEITTGKALCDATSSPEQVTSNA